MPRFPPTPTRLQCLLWAPCLLLWGCDILGGQGGDDTGGDCPQSVTPVADEQPGPLSGLEADALLGWATGERAVTAHWNPARGDIATNVPVSDTELSITLTRGEGPATEQTCGGARLHVPVVVEAATADGLLSFEREGDLHAARPDFARVVVELDFDDLDGDFVWVSEAPGVELVQPTLRMTLTPRASSGSFDAILQERSNGALGNPAGGLPLLHWPTDSPCDTDEVGIPLAGSDGIWGDAVAVANAGGWLEQTGTSEGEPFSIDLQAPDALCEDEHEGVRLPVQIGLRSADGLIDLLLHGSLTDTDGVLEFTPGPPYPEGHPSTFQERFGDFGFDLSPYESVQIELTLELTDDGGTGRIALLGGIDDCQNLDPSAGCGPLRDELLFERTFELAR